MLVLIMLQPQTYSRFCCIRKGINAAEQETTIDFRKTWYAISTDSDHKRLLYDIDMGMILLSQKTLQPSSATSQAHLESITVAQSWSMELAQLA